MLATVKNLLDELANAAVNLTSAAGAGRAFELLVMTSVATELKSRGYLVNLLRSDGVVQLASSSDITFVQRGGMPSGVRAAAAGVGGPTSILFQRGIGASEWEIWNGVQFIGRSAGTHEFDLAIVPRQLGDSLRAVGGRPFGHGWISIECKDVAAGGSPDEMRAFLARIYDTTLLTFHAPYLGGGVALKRIHPIDPSQPGFGTASCTYREENLKIYNAIVRRTGFTAGTVDMSNYYFVRRFDNVAVGSTNLQTFKNEICDWIDKSL